MQEYASNKIILTVFFIVVYASDRGRKSLIVKMAYLNYQLRTGSTIKEFAVASYILNSPFSISQLFQREYFPYAP